MSDLQCPARVLLVPHAGTRDDRGLSAEGRERARALARSLAAERVTMVYSGGAAVVAETAGAVAEALGVPVRVVEGLTGLPAGGADGGESAGDVAARMADELETLTDLHRGEAVLVVGDPRTIARTVAHLTGRSPGGRSPGGRLGPGDVVELAADADGWALRSGEGV